MINILPLPYINNESTFEMKGMLSVIEGYSKNIVWHNSSLFAIPPTLCSPKHNAQMNFSIYLRHAGDTTIAWNAEVNQDKRLHVA